MKHALRWLFTVTVILVSLVNSGGAAALSAGQKQLYQAGVQWFDRAIPCSTDGSSDSATLQSSTIPDITLTDSSRGGRAITVTVYLPSDGAPHPLILFAPGQSQNSKSNGFYARYLKAMAASGFVVAGINFPDNTSDAAIPSEAQDINFVASQITSNAALAGHLNSNTIGLVGHSDGGIAAMIAEYSDGSDSQSDIGGVMVEDARLQSGFTFGKKGPPLFVTHGTLDTIEPLAHGQTLYNTAQTSYKAFAQFIGADHHSYITGGPSVQKGPLHGKDLSAFNPAVDALTAAFFGQILGTNGTSNTDLLSVVAAKYSDVVSFAQHGTEPSKPAVTIGSDSSTSANSCCNTATTADAGGTVAAGDPSKNVEPIYDYLVSHGLKPYMAAAIMGNMKDESGYDPTIDEGGAHSAEPLSYNSGFGLIQWTFGRQAPLVALAHAAGKPSSDLDSQLQYILVELNGAYKGTVLTPLLASTNVVDAERIVEIYYESHQNPTVLQPGRLAEAQRVLAKYGSTTVPPATSGTIIDTASASTSSDGSSSSSCDSSAPSGNVVKNWPFDAGVTVYIYQCFFYPPPLNHHPGLDLSAIENTPIHSMTTGTVVTAGDGGGYGPNFVAINPDPDNPAGNYGTSYGHMNKMFVKVGQKVNVGDVIGLEGNLGDSQGAHLHFNEFPGKYIGWDSNNINPTPFLSFPKGTVNHAACPGVVIPT